MIGEMLFAVFWDALPGLAVVAIAAYLLGSIPFGIVVAQVMGLGNLRQIGSGNIGATNVLRTGSKTAAALTVALDGGKGFAAAFAADWFFGTVLLAYSAEPFEAALTLKALFGHSTALLAAFFVLVGHLFPVWLRFRGGKGVATFIGAVLALSFLTGVVTCAAWLAAALASRKSSVGAIAAVIAAPVGIWLLTVPESAAVTALMSLLVLSRHHKNIRRLATGTEPDIKLHSEGSRKNGQ